MPTDFSAFHGRESQVRAETLARLFEAVHEGIYSGLLSKTRTVTLAANPHRKWMLGFAPETVRRVASAATLQRKLAGEPRPQRVSLDLLQRRRDLRAARAPRHDPKIAG